MGLICCYQDCCENKNSSFEFPQTHNNNGNDPNNNNNNNNNINAYNINNYNANINSNNNNNNNTNNKSDKNKNKIKKNIKRKTLDYLSISKEFLIKECKVPKSKLDKKGDCLGGWRVNDKNGPPGYLKDYIPPKGWTGVGLTVQDNYDEGDNTWLGREKKNGEWYICYHGTKTKKSIANIIKYNFEPGPRQAFEDSDNENPLTNSFKTIVGNGIYFAKDINEAKNYTKIINYKNYKLRVVFMCRINPEMVKICNDDEYYVVSGGNVDNEVRPYRVLFHFE